MVKADIGLGTVSAYWHRCCVVCLLHDVGAVHKWFHRLMAEHRVWTYASTKTNNTIGLIFRLMRRVPSLRVGEAEKKEEKVASVHVVSGSFSEKRKILWGGARKGQRVIKEGLNG